MIERDWDFCDQCIFFMACLRKEKKTRGEGCDAFSSYPYEIEEADRSTLLTGFLSKCHMEREEVIKRREKS
jgi:hypothetical protein